MDRAAKPTAHQRPGASHHLDGSEAPRRTPSAMVRQPDYHKRHPRTGFQVSRPARPCTRSTRGMRVQVPSPVPKAYQGSGQCSCRLVVEGRGASRRVRSHKGKHSISISGAPRSASDRSVYFPSTTSYPYFTLRSPFLWPWPRMPWPRIGTNSLRSISSLLPCTRRCPAGSSSTKGGGSESPRVSSLQSPPVPKEVSCERNSPGTTGAGGAWSSGEGYRKVTSLSREEFLRSVYQRAYNEEVLAGGPAQPLSGLLATPVRVLLETLPKLASR